MSAPLLLTWLAGTLLPLGTLWLVYRLALRGERCFGYNRAFLLLAPVLAAALPLLPRPAVPLWLSGPATAAAGKTGVAVLLPTVEVGQVASAGAEWSVWTWLGGLYLAGVVLGLGRIAWQAGRLWRLARRLPREVRPGYVLARTGGRLPTSSFGRVVFWDETAGLSLAEELAVLTHEVAHVRQRHTLDVLWLEAWRAVLWPNPFAHLLLPGLRLTHELLADAAAAPATGATTYPTLLARLAARRLGAPAYSALLQPFTFSFTLTRIAMLQNQNSVRRWKQWLVLPALGGLFFFGSRAVLAQGGPVPDKAHAGPKLTEAQQKERLAVISHKLRVAQRQDSLRTDNKLEPGTMQQFHITNMKGPGEPIVTVTRVKAGGPDGTVDVEPGSGKAYTQTPPPPRLTKKGGNGPTVGTDGAKLYTFVEQMPHLPGEGGVQAIVQAIQNKIVYPAGEKMEGRIFATFVVAADGTVRDTKIIKGLSPAYDAAVLTAIRQLPIFVPGKQDGQAVAVSFTVPVQFKTKS